MCKVVEILYGCGHPHSYPLIKECHAGFFPGGILCGRQSTEIIQSLTLVGYPHCIEYCFGAMKLDIEIKYLLERVKLFEDARKVGWTEADIRGSHFDLQKDFERELGDLREVCSVSNDSQNQGPEPVTEDNPNAIRRPSVTSASGSSEVFEKSSTPVTNLSSDLDSYCEGFTGSEGESKYPEIEWFEECLDLAEKSSTPVTSPPPDSEPFYVIPTDTDGEGDLPHPEQHKERLVQAEQPCGGRLNPCGNDQCDGYRIHNAQLKLLPIRCDNNECNGYHSYEDCPLERKCSGCHSTEHYRSHCREICTACGHERHTAEHCHESHLNRDGTSSRKRKNQLSNALTPRSQRLRGGLTQSWRAS